MKKMKFTLMGFAVALVMFSCSKDQAVVKDLEGNWKISSYKENGKSEDITFVSQFTYNFTSCKLKKEDVCPASISTTQLGVNLTQNFSYSISEKGTILTMTQLSTVTSVGGLSNTENCTSNCTESYTIAEHSDTKIVLTDVEDDGDVIELTLTKI